MYPDCTCIQAPPRVRTSGLLLHPVQTVVSLLPMSNCAFMYLNSVGSFSPVPVVFISLLNLTFYNSPVICWSRLV